MAEDFGRRDFLKTSAVAAAAVGALAGPARAASDKVNIGWVGTGTRGYFVMDQMYKANAAEAAAPSNSSEQSTGTEAKKDEGVIDAEYVDVDEKK